MGKHVGLDSPAVQSHLTILQGVISRMAANSASAKAWCVALVSAMLVILSERAEPQYVWVALLPIVLFLFLDAYYLGLERQFRHRYNDFITKLHEGTAEVQDVFIVTLDSGFWKVIRAAFVAGLSVSVWPFYVLLMVMLLAVQVFVL